MDTATREPIFRGQEQAVVYFFSRYWHQIEPFCHKRLDDIQTRFPDASMEDKRDRDWAAIEFEYALTNFYSHISSLKAKATWKTLNDAASDPEDPYDSLYIVYWEEDADKEEQRQIREKCKKHCPNLKRVEFVDLSKYFSPCFEPEPDHLEPYWEFRQEKCFDEVYSFAEIKAETLKLEEEGVIRRLKVNDGLRGRDRIYKVAGFNKSRANFIECDHWKRIHFYTTSASADASIPARLFLKPTGCQRISGCFEVKLAFKIVQPENSALADYYRRFYFYPYKEFDPEYLLKKTCLVYSGFTELDAHRGVKLWNFLDQYYTFGPAGYLIRDPRHLARIDDIVG